MEDLQQNNLPKNEDTEVENEDNTEVTSEIPFDPSHIRVSTQPLTLGELIDRLEHNEINMNTEFQRLPDLWDNVKKSRFIESLLLRLPIPTFYFDIKDDGNWAVIDGLQRLSTLHSFAVKKDLKLQNLEFLKDFEGKLFDELSREMQRRIKTFPITVYLLERGTPDIVKYNIFSRINQGGLILKPQEIRHALHQGIAANLVADLVRANDEKNPETGEIIKRATEEGKLFAKITEGKIKSQRMEDRDFATRFAVFYLIPYDEYTPDLDSFMNKGMAKIGKLNEEECQKIKDNFKNALETAFAIYGNDAFRKRYKREDARRPINKSLFEVLTVSFAKLSQEDRQTLIERKEILINKQVALLNNLDRKFYNAITASTAKKENVIKRFQDIEQIIKETLSND